jgi:hypothetical protein
MRTGADGKLYPASEVSMDLLLYLWESGEQPVAADPCSDAIQASESQSADGQS